MKWILAFTASWLSAGDLAQAGVDRVPPKVLGQFYSEAAESIDDLRIAFNSIFTPDPSANCFQKQPELRHKIGEWLDQERPRWEIRLQKDDDRTSQLARDIEDARVDARKAQEEEPATRASRGLSRPNEVSTTTATETEPRTFNCQQAIQAEKLKLMAVANAYRHMNFNATLILQRWREFKKPIRFVPANGAPPVCQKIQEQAKKTAAAAGKFEQKMEALAKELVKRALDVGHDINALPNCRTNSL